MAVFYVVPAVMLAVGVSVLWYVAYSVRRIRGAWRSGAHAEGVCVRAWYRGSGNGPFGESRGGRQYHVYEFTPRGAGAPVRFKEGDGDASVVAGDRVTVYYPPERPKRATAFAPGTAPFLAYGLICLVVCLFCWGVGSLLLTVVRNP